ncbi:hypothetical protein OS187_05635 [Xanthomonadaceae bacterium JHOS43]|nr:hypothetical protein [Xanthomonadaceae bacterium JHOS43]MCX7562438.1 hypothetical protein [Xanthomonadaceae bacterium XH05]
MSVRVSIFIVVAAAASVVICPRAHAEDGTLPSSVKRVERETGGRVLSAERRNQSGREINRIKVYTPEGRVRVMWDEPRNQAPQATPRPKPQSEASALRARSRDDRR